MTEDRRRLDPGELASGEPGLDGEVGTAWSMARTLERSLDATADARPAAGYIDRVMLALADEPTPARAAFTAPLWAGGGLAGLLGSVRAAWHVATEGSLRVRPRATALAYVLAIALVGSSVVGVAGYGLAGALGWLANPSSTPPPSGPILPGPTSLTAPSPEESQEPGESLEPGETNDAGGEPGDGSNPGATDDHGGGSPGATSGDDHGGATPSGSPRPSSTQGDEHGGSPTPSSGETQTPRPSQTADPSQTPKATESPHPTSTSGSGSGSGSDG